MIRSKQLLVCRTHCRSCPLSRRGFLTGCAVSLGTSLAPVNSWSAPDDRRKPQVRVVFCQPRNDRPTWPNVGYDYESREEQILSSLRQGVANVQFLPARMVDQSVEQSGLVDRDGEVDGYVICLLGLGWQYRIDGLAAMGKPTLVVDNLFGGSGMFLTRTGDMIAKHKHVDWVSSATDQDLIASARHFALLADGHTPLEVAAAFRETRRRRTPLVTDWNCRSDPVAVVNFQEALARLESTRILVVGGGWGGEVFRNAARQVSGVTFIPIGFDELAAACDAADTAAAAAFADRWIASAEAMVEPSRDDVQASGAMYVGMKHLLQKHDASGISINCLGGFYGGHLKAYPCLGFTEFNNEGAVGGCEADQMSALTMTIVGALTGRPGFISDPVIDTSEGQIIYAHCVAMTKPFGADGPANAYRIRSHSEDRNGAAIQSLLPADYMTTTLEINPVSRQVLFHQAKSAGNNSSDMACRTKLEAYVKGDIEKLTEHWRMGWHRVTFYGDLKPTVAELCDRWELDLIEEA